MFTKLIIEKWNEWSVRWNKPCETWLYFTTPHWLSSFGGSRKDVLPIIIQYIVSLLFICQASLSYCSTWTREMYSSLDNNTRWWRCVCLAAARIPKRMRNVDQLDIIPGMLCVLFLNLFFFLYFLLILFLIFLFCSSAQFWHRQEKCCVEPLGVFACSRSTQEEE